MREILFKWKRIDNGEWVEGVPFFGIDGYICMIFSKTENGYGYIEEFPIYTKSACQYIGLTDKNGVKIFEGDILITKYGSKCVVTWFQPQVCFDLNPTKKEENLIVKAPDKYDLWYRKNIEIIGNIYDNPELLEDGN